ncbi:MAG: hypothetical protein K2X82_26185 [Gemmataceae bacterium]|nr:hypothetical protein [Gemmataceae bacterium]
MADEPKLPTEEDIARLPRWARVAFAARCARQSLAAFTSDWPTSPEAHTRAVVDAVQTAERAAEMASPTLPGVGLPTVAAAAAQAADPASAANAFAAAAAAQAAAAAASFDPIAAAARAADAGVPTSTIRQDYGVVAAAAAQGGWDDATPVAPVIFEPLGRSVSDIPIGDFELSVRTHNYLRRMNLRTLGDLTRVTESQLLASKNFGEASLAEVRAIMAAKGLRIGSRVEDDDFTLVLRAVAKPGVTADAVRKHAVALFQVLNEYSLEKYGRRLTKDRFRRLVLEHTGVGV